MKQNLLVTFHFYGVWSAKTLLKVCYTSISMRSFYKLTFFGFDGFTSSSPAMRDMVTEDSGWGTLKLYKVKKQLIEIVKTWQTFPFKSSDSTITNMRRFAKSYQTCLQWRKTKNQIESSRQSGSMLWDSVVWWKCPMEG